MPKYASENTGTTRCRETTQASTDRTKRNKVFNGRATYPVSGHRNSRFIETNCIQNATLILTCMWRYCHERRECVHGAADVGGTACVGLEANWG